MTRKKEKWHCKRKISRWISFFNEIFSIIWLVCNWKYFFFFSLLEHMFLASRRTQGPTVLTLQIRSFCLVFKLIEFYWVEKAYQTCQKKFENGRKLILNLNSSHISRIDSINIDTWRQKKKKIQSIYCMHRFLTHILSWSSLICFKNGVVLKIKGELTNTILRSIQQSIWHKQKNINIEIQRRLNPLNPFPHQHNTRCFLLFYGFWVF